MLTVPKNKFAITYLAFTGGFLMVFIGNMVMAVDTPQTGPLYEFTSPAVHSMDIAGGYNDSDNSGVSINNDGRLQIKTRTLTGSYIETANSPYDPQYGFNIASTKGGLHSTALYNPVAGRNDMRVMGKGDPNEYGRVGVEGRVVGNATGLPTVTKGFVGYLQNMAIGGAYTEYQPLPATVPDVLVPFAFYTTGNTYLGDNVTVNGALKNGGTGVTIAGDTTINGNLDISNNLETDVLNFSNVTNLDARFLIGDPDAGALIPAMSDYGDLSSGDIFDATRSCAPDAYLVGCTGYVVGANSYAPYRGAEMTSTSAKGGDCTAYAKSQGSAAPFKLWPVPYCFDPN